MKPQPRIAYLLVTALLASLVAPGVSVAVAAEDEVLPAAIEETSVDAPTLEAAAMDATVTVWSDSDALDFDIDPIADVYEPRTRRVTLSVSSTQPYALRVLTEGDFTVLAEPASAVGQQIPASVMRLARDGTDDWHSLSSVPTTIAEETDVSVERTYSFVFEIYAGEAPGWSVSAGGYEMNVCFDVVPLDVPAAPSLAAPAAEDVLPPATEATAAPADAQDDPAAIVVDPASQPESVVATPPPLPAFVLQGTVTATLTSDVETATDMVLWLAGTELASATNVLTFAELAGYRLMLTLDGAIVGELAPYVSPATVVDSVPVIDAYSCSWDTTGVPAGDHVLGVLAKTSDEDPGIVCWGASITVVPPLPATLAEVPAAIEGSVAPVPTPVPDSNLDPDLAEGGGAAG